MDWKLDVIKLFILLGVTQFCDQLKNVILTNRCMLA